MNAKTVAAHLLDERVAEVVGRERDNLVHQVMSNLSESVNEVLQPREVTKDAPRRLRPSATRTRASCGSREGAARRC